MNNLNNIFSFLEFLNRFRDIERVLTATGLDRKETDLEHSYQLAMLAWYIVDHFKLDLDLSKVLRYALVHDLVEVYAGDTPFWGDDAGKDNKDEREEEALRKIGEQFGDTFSQMTDIIREYEDNKTKSEEARFVYALDKLIPVLNAYQDNGRTWKELYPTLDAETLIRTKKALIAHSPHIEKIFDELVPLMRERKDELFGGE